MADGIFVSYSHKDIQVVEQIVATLQEASGLDVWFDHRLRGGENYFSVIANEIVNNPYFVFVVSEHSIQSDWCLRELEFAASEKRRIIAVWLDDVDISPRIKLVIQNTHYVNWYSGPNDLFSKTLLSAFSDEVASANAFSIEYEEILPQGQRYFLTKKERQKLAELLRAEENGKQQVCFVPENANLLGMAYEMGLSVETDTKKALLYYRASAYGNNADGKYLYAALKYRETEEVRYVADMQDAAEQGSALALTCVGDAHYFGKWGLTADIHKAYTFFERAAKLGGVVATYYTAFGYLYGEGLAKDPELAYMLTLKALEHEFPRAYRLMGAMYKEGVYVEADVQKSIDWYEEAIRHGDDLSYCYQGFMYGKQGNIEKKVELYQKALELAEQGKLLSASPYFRMAVLYEDGEGVEQDLERALNYYFKAAELGSKAARKWTVPCIMKLDADRREPYLKKAFAHNCEDAAYRLGWIEKNKRADSKERLSAEAVHYFEVGAENGDMRCAMELIREFSTVIGRGKAGDEEDRNSAIKWFRVLFANADEGFFAKVITENERAVYYYAYGVALANEPDADAEDWEFVLYNFKKALEISPVVLLNVLGTTVNGYLCSIKRNREEAVHVPNTEAVLKLVAEKQDAYLAGQKPDGVEARKNEIRHLLRRAYLFMAQCYRYGGSVDENVEKAEYYAKLANDLYE